MKYLMMQFKSGLTGIKSKRLVMILLPHLKCVIPIIEKDVPGCGFDGIIAGAGSHIEVNGNVIFDCLMKESLVQYCIDVFQKIIYSAVLKALRGSIPIKRWKICCKMGQQILRIPSWSVCRERWRAAWTSRNLMDILAAVPTSFASPVLI